MRTTIVTVGSRGDVQPYVALGRGLQAAGYQVRLATHAMFEPLVRDHGLDFYPVEGNPRAIVESPAGQEWQRSGGNPVRFFRGLRQATAPVVRPLTIDCWQACQDAALVIYSGLAFLPVQAVSANLRAVLAAAYIQPATPTRAFAAARFPPAPAGLRWVQGGYNRLTHVLMDYFFWFAVRDPINATRREVLDLPPLPHRPPFAVPRRHKRLHLYAFSEHVVPRPPDWAAWNHITGYWFLDRPAEWQPPPALLAFLESGPPPVCVGFGSMNKNNREAEEGAAIVIAALDQAGQRGLLLTGWGGLRRDELPDTIFQIEDVPHDWLFPRVTAVVHHGGAGTTAAGVRAGKPAVIIPVFGDQAFWGRRAQALGVAPEPIPRERLAVAPLAAAIRTATGDQQMRRRAAVLAERIQAEDGVRTAVEIVQQHFRREENGARVQL